MLTGVALFASLGLPGFSGFVGELFTLMGGFKAAVVPTWVAALGTIGIILAAAYFLWTLQRMFLGKLWAKNQDDLAVLYDLDAREKWMLVPLGLLAFLIGILPNSLFPVSYTHLDVYKRQFLTERPVRESRVNSNNRRL